MNTAQALDRVTSDACEARSAWRHRAVLVGAGFQVAFGGFWLARGLMPLIPVPLAVLAGAATLVWGLTAAVRLRRLAPRPQGAAARRFEWRLTLATVAQLVVSGLLPPGLGAVAGGRLELPSIVLTIGILLAWIHHELNTPYQGTAGWMLIGLAVAAPWFTGGTQNAVTGLASAGILLCCAWAGLRWLNRGSSTQAPVPGLANAA